MPSCSCAGPGRPLAPIGSVRSSGLAPQTPSARQQPQLRRAAGAPAAALGPQQQQQQGGKQRDSAGALRLSRRGLRLSRRAAPPPLETASAKAEAAAAKPPEEEAPPPPGGPMLDADLVGKLCLLAVAMLWGSYNPILRLLYAQDGPPGPVAIMLFRGVLQAAVLAAAYSLLGRRGGDAADSDGSQEAAAAAAAAAAASSNGGGMGPAPSWLQQWVSKLPFTAVAATELGLWLFLATAIQTLGLQLTTATRAGFLIQATALLTPLLASFTGEKPSRNVWAGCIVALAGCLFIAADDSATDADDAALFSLGGDAAILSSAFFFSLATVRLGTYARRIRSVELAAAKSVVLGAAAFATFVFAASSMVAAGDPVTDLWPGYTNPLAWGILVYTALGPGAAAAFLHAKGQSVVPPAEAQVIFSTVPLWSLLFAFILLGGEPMSEKTILGGAAVVAAGLIASRKGESTGQPPAATGQQRSNDDKSA